MYRLLLCALLVAMSLRIPAWGAIAEVGTSTSCDTGATGVTTLSCAHDAGTGTDRITILGLSQRALGAPTVVTYGGQAMTQIQPHDHSTIGISCRLFYLVNPPTSSNTAQVDFDFPVRYVVGLISFSGVRQTTPFSTQGSAEVPVTSSTVSVTLTSTAGEVVVDVVAKVSATPAMTAGANQTEEWSDNSTGGTLSDLAGAGSTEPGAASVTMSWELNESIEATICAGSLVPVGVPSQQRTRSVIMN